MGIAENIRLFRKNAGLTQEQLANKAKLSIATIQGYEQKKYKPKSEALYKLCDALGCNIGELYGLQEGDEVNIPEPSLVELRKEVSNLILSLNEKGLERTRDYMKDLMGNPKYHPIKEKNSEKAHW